MKLEKPTNKSNHQQLKQTLSSKCACKMVWDNHCSRGPVWGLCIVSKPCTGKNTDLAKRQFKSRSAVQADLLLVKRVKLCLFQKWVELVAPLWARKTVHQLNLACIARCYCTSHSFECNYCRQETNLELDRGACNNCHSGWNWQWKNNPDSSVFTPSRMDCRYLWFHKRAYKILNKSKVNSSWAQIVAC